MIETIIYEPEYVTQVKYGSPINKNTKHVGVDGTQVDLFVQKGKEKHIGVLVHVKSTPVDAYLVHASDHQIFDFGKMPLDELNGHVLLSIRKATYRRPVISKRDLLDLWYHHYIHESNDTKDKLYDAVTTMHKEFRE